MWPCILLGMCCGSSGERYRPVSKLQKEIQVHYILSIYFFNYFRFYFCSPLLLLFCVFVSISHNFYLFLIRYCKNVFLEYIYVFLTELTIDKVTHPFISSTFFKHFFPFFSSFYLQQKDYNTNIVLRRDNRKR